MVAVLSALVRLAQVNVDNVFELGLRYALGIIMLVVIRSAVTTYVVVTSGLPVSSHLVTLVPESAISVISILLTHESFNWMVSASMRLFVTVWAIVIVTFYELLLVCCESDAMMVSAV